MNSLLAMLLSCVSSDYTELRTKVNAVLSSWCQAKGLTVVAMTEAEIVSCVTIRQLLKAIVLKMIALPNMTYVNRSNVSIPCTSMSSLFVAFESDFHADGSQWMVWSLLDAMRTVAAKCDAAMSDLTTILENIKETDLLRDKDPLLYTRPHNNARLSDVSYLSTLFDWDMSTRQPLEEGDVEFYLRGSRLAQTIKTAINNSAGYQLCEQPTIDAVFEVVFVSLIKQNGRTFSFDVTKIAYQSRDGDEQSVGGAASVINSLLSLRHNLPLIYSLFLPSTI